MLSGFFVLHDRQCEVRASGRERRRRTRSAPFRSAICLHPRTRLCRSLVTAQHLSRRWTFPPFCTTMIVARKDAPSSRTHAPVAQLDRVSDSDSEGHRFDSCRVYHKSFCSLGQESYRSLTRFARRQLFSPAPRSVDPRHGNKLLTRFFHFHRSAPLFRPRSASSLRLLPGVPSQAQGVICSTPQQFAGCLRMRLRLLFASQKCERSPRSSFLHYISKLSRCSLIFAPRGRLSPLFIKSGIPWREFLLTRAGVLPLSFCSLGQESYRSLTRFARRQLFSPAPRSVDPRHVNKLPRTSFTFTAQPRYSVLAPLRPYDSCRVYHRRRKASFAAPRKNLWGARVCACGCSSRRKNTDVRPAPRFCPTRKIIDFSRGGPDITLLRNYRVAL